MKNKKLKTLVGSLALVGAIAVGATLAYFTDSQEAVNIITMGHVDIDLEEPNFPEDKEIDDVTPNQEITKDPTIIVKADSEDMYLRAKIELEGFNNVDDADTHKEQLLDNINIQPGWMLADDGYYYFQYVVGKTNVDQRIVFFDKVTIPANWGNEVADLTFKINVTAEAIQADNFTPETNDNGNIVGWNNVTPETYTPATSNAE